MNLPAIRDNMGIVRQLGHLAMRPRPRLMLARPVLAPLPQSEWVEFELDPGPIKVKDQGQHGACNGHAAASSEEWARWLAGLGYVPLSSWFVYSILCNGVDQGSSIGDALKLLTDEGTCPESDVPWGTINPRSLSAGAKTAAGAFKIEVGSPLRNFDEMMTATQLRRPFNFSLCVGANFNNLDADGVVPTGRGPGNHAICGGLGAKKLKSGEWVIKWQNSWTTQWGQGGLAWVRRSSIDNQPYFDAYDVAAVMDNPADPDNPPVVA